MSFGLLSLIAALLYFGAGGLYLKRLVEFDPEAEASTGYVWVIALTAVILHAIVLYNSLIAGAGFSLGFTNAASLVTWVIAGLFLLSTLTHPIHNLGALVMPVAMVAVVAQWLWPMDPAVSLATNTPVFRAHLVIALLGYAFLALAALQALLLIVQDRRLQQHHPGRLLRGLPPIQTMDRLLFHLIAFGFVFLSLTIISGVYFTEQIFGSPLMFNHHTVLAIIGWGVFATLLAGRWGFGWRGRTAATWTLVGFVVLLLGYFGTKFVVEVLLDSPGPVDNR